MNKTSENKLAAARDWKRRNKERLKEYDRFYYKTVIRSRPATEKEKASGLARSRAWKRRNKDRLLQYQRKFRESGYQSKWGENNPDKIKHYRKTYAERNPENLEIHRLNGHIKRRAKQKNAGKIRKGIISDLTVAQNGTCRLCPKPLCEGYHLDHIYPLSKGGDNRDSNLQLLCPRCNLKKSNKIMPEITPVLTDAI